MTERLLKTQLYIPPPRPNRVPRPRLVERLNAGLRQNGAFAHKLSLISAPAGFGKTTLASEWIAACRRLEPDVDVAGLSLDAGDNDPSRFWTYVVAALQTVDADVGAAALGLLQEPQPRPVELFLTALIAVLTPIPDGNVWLVRNHEQNGSALNGAFGGPQTPAPYDSSALGGTTTTLVTPRGEITHRRGRSRATAPDRLNAAYRASQVAFYEKHHPRWAPVLKAYLRMRGQAR